ncbi:astacin-like metalloendopeptidase [Amia ocellicauda]|uniref:astacin-like metalloendopeptidase n=1 Tax=Amia ocellicauda TaxID=2972642 RepID=UPI00346498E8
MELRLFLLCALAACSASAPVNKTSTIKKQVNGKVVPAMDAIIAINQRETKPFTASRTISFTDIAIPNSRTAMVCPGLKDCFWDKSSDGFVYVPYVIDPSYAASEQRLILDTLASFSTFSCIVFQPRSDEVDFISIVPLGGCWSLYGRGGGEQQLSLSRAGCVAKHIISHELMHALGFYHEHSRSDRDNYIEVLWDNIQPEYQRQFMKMNTNNLDVPYDYQSILHYSWNAFAKSPALMTLRSITDIPPRVGLGTKMTPSDILRVNRLYKCDGKVSLAPTTKPTTTSTTTTTTSPTTTTTTTTTTAEPLLPDDAPQDASVSVANKACGYNLTTATGSISSPNYPNAYNNNQMCQWTITTKNKLYLTFKAMALEDSVGCKYDYVSIYDLIHKTHIGPKLCGFQIPSPITTPSKSIMIEFKADYSVNNKGFLISYMTL